jgi:hypothetical protein
LVFTIIALKNSSRLLVFCFPLSECISASCNSVFLK